MKFVDWVVARLHERGRLKTSQREERAMEYEAAADRYREACDDEAAGRYRLAARILKAGD